MIRKAKIDDLKQIMVIINEAKLRLRKSGLMQWNVGNYPNKDTFLNDIKNDSLFVYEDKIITGVMCCIKENNLSYLNIEGKWLNQDNYMVIHRIAVKEEYLGQGIAKKLINHAINYAQNNNSTSIKIDTHPKNIPMNNLINSLIFTFCGIIKLTDTQIEPERKAYELQLRR